MRRITLVMIPLVFVLLAAAGFAVSKTTNNTNKKSLDIVNETAKKNETPEPATLAILGFGSLVLLRKR